MASLAKIRATGVRPGIPRRLDDRTRPIARHAPRRLPPHPPHRGHGLHPPPHARAAGFHRRLVTPEEGPSRPHRLLRSRRPSRGSASRLHMPGSRIQQSRHVNTSWRFARWGSSPPRRPRHRPPHRRRRRPHRRTHRRHGSPGPGNPNRSRKGGQPGGAHPSFAAGMREAVGARRPPHQIPPRYRARNLRLLRLRIRPHAFRQSQPLPRLR